MFSPEIPDIECATVGRWSPFIGLGVLCCGPRRPAFSRRKRTYLARVYRDTMIRWIDIGADVLVSIPPLKMAPIFSQIRIRPLLCYSKKKIFRWIFRWVSSIFVGIVHLSFVLRSIFQCRTRHLVRYRILVTPSVTVFSSSRLSRCSRRFVRHLVLCFPSPRSLQRVPVATFDNLLLFGSLPPRPSPTPLRRFSFF